MPSYHRSTSPLDTAYAHSSSTASMSSYTTPTGLDSPKLSPVAMTSLATTRQPTNAQLWTLYHFEIHAVTCASCHNPYHVHRAGLKLCRTGHLLAETAVHTLGLGDGQVEVPVSYQQVRSLVKAIERSKRHPRQTPIVRASRSSSRSLADRKTTKEKDAPIPTLVTTPKKSKSTSPSPKSSSPRKSILKTAVVSAPPSPGKQKPVSTASLRNKSPRLTPTTEPTMSSRSYKTTVESAPPSPVLPASAAPPSPRMAVSFDNAFIPSPYLDTLPVPFLVASTKRQHSPKPAPKATSSGYENFDVEIREPRKKARA